ncbi:MAG: methyltransferase domain-containing protein [Chloroflexi bacterium]|nr:methyltransferase domain-containing protein [Chloroflexota bacterium]
MTNVTPTQPDDHAKEPGSHIYGYSSPAVQAYYVEREAAAAADFFLPHLSPGMSLLDCGCGPGTITFGLAEAVAPAETIGVDLEPSMIGRAEAFAKERNVPNVRFQVADIFELPFDEGSFDVVYSRAVLEHLGEPVQALKEMGRVLKPGGLIGVVSNDWAEPLISPSSEAVSLFFDLFERGFNRNRGSMNRGRHLKIMMLEAGFTVAEFSASYGNTADPEAVAIRIDAYIDWIENLPLFEQAVDLGWIDRPSLERMCAEMKEWGDRPDAFMAVARCTAIGRKS